MNGEEHGENLLERIEHLFQHLIERIEQMAVDQTLLDSDIAALTQAVADLSTAVANIPAPVAVDLTAEDDAVNAATAALTPVPVAAVEEPVSEEG